MAEIKIEKKKPVWPWILLVLLILAVIAYFLYENNDNDDYADDATIEEVDDINSTSIDTNEPYDNTTNYTDSRDYITIYSASIMDSTRIGNDTTYTKTALYNLAKTVRSKAESIGITNSTAMENLNNFTSRMDGMSDSTMRNKMGISQNVKSVSTDIVSVIERIQTQKYPALQNEVADLKQTSNKITATTIEKQQMTLQNFFRKAKEVLTKMNS